MGTIKQEIENDLKQEINGRPDPNSWGRTNFGLMVEGSYEYDGEAKYNHSKQFVQANKSNRKQLRMFVIRNFTEMIAKEYECSYGHAQKCVTGLATKGVLASYTNLLIADVIEQFN